MKNTLSKVVNDKLNLECCMLNIINNPALADNSK